ncbi:neprilysin-1-like [Planococcus citri]|uniref:neprilysin-1-like n=1 Tax=Planococcus citri TaxID=170843 RepID=UPI0031F9DB4F
MVLEIDQFFIVRIFIFVYHFFGCFFNAMTVTGSGTATVKDKPGEEIFLEEVNGNGSVNGDVEPVTKEEINHYKPRKSILTRRIKIRTVVTGIILIFIVYFIYVLLGFLFWKTERFCLTPKCKRAEKYLKKSINDSVDPCDNFYEFACGNWRKHHPIPNDMFGVDEAYHIEIQSATNLREFLIGPDHDHEPVVVHKARTLFKSCLRAVHELETNDFERIADVLVQENLPKIFNLEKFDNYSWVPTAVLSKKLINRNLFIEFDIRMDLKDHLLKRISIKKPKNMIPLSTHRFFGRKSKAKTKLECEGYLSVYKDSDEDITEDVAMNTTYYKYLKLMAKYMYRQMAMSWTVETESKFNDIFVPFLRFSNRIEKLLNDPNEEAYPPRYISIEELQKLTDRISECNHIRSIINWKHYLKSIFEDVINIDIHLEGQDSTIIISDFEYIKSILKLLAETPPYVIEFYAWWQNVEELIPFTTDRLKNYMDQYKREIGREKVPRELFCIKRTRHELAYAIVYFLAHDEIVRKNIAKVSDMMENIKSAFLEEINLLRWLDRDTKLKLAEKLRQTKEIIGFPDWMDDANMLKRLYTDLELREDDFFGNMVAIRQENFKMKLENLRESDAVVNDGWLINLLTHRNAYYINELNTIVIPANMFAFPFYQLGIEALNYGKIGVIIGHELTHGFDTLGREFDWDGMIQHWWSNRTKIEFETRKKCFITHYTEYNFTDTAGALTRITLNGTRTLDENIADNGGVRIAFNAYKNIVKKIGPEKLLYGLRQYTDDQLYFLAFANSWCQVHTTHSLHWHAMDNHSPGFVRVLAPLINSKEFADVWHCKRGTPMNPKRMKCKIW